MDNLSFSGFSKAWVYARRNDTFYLINKFLSLALATSLAIYTQSIKLDVVKYVKDHPNDEAGTSYNIIYWTLFIFYAFHAVDELIELYAVYFKREKGALGLLLELNYFLGAFIMVWILIFIRSDNALSFSTNSDNAHIYDWLHY